MKSTMISYGIFIMLAVCSTACSPAGNSSPELQQIDRDMYTSTAEIFYLDEVERKSTESRALEGNAEAIDAMINHYELGGVENSTANLIFWLQRAYENGDERRLKDLIFFAADSDLSCAEIISFFEDLKKLDPAEASKLRRGRVATCLDDVMKRQSHRGDRRVKP